MVLIPNLNNIEDQSIDMKHKIIAFPNTHSTKWQKIIQSIVHILFQH